MKLNSPLHATMLSIALAGVGLLALSGCAGTNQTGSKGKQALVCPQCKMVAEMVDFHDDTGPSPVDSHTCPKCQGALQTFLHEGKLQHKCSICKDSPFTCPVFHPTSS